MLRRTDNSYGIHILHICIEDWIIYAIIYNGCVHMIFTHIITCDKSHATKIVFRIEEIGLCGYSLIYFLLCTCVF